MTLPKDKWKTLEKGSQKQGNGKPDNNLTITSPVGRPAGGSSVADSRDDGEGMNVPTCRFVEKAFCFLGREKGRVL